ncbi:aldo/keto reductase [Streptomyces hydrogenans]|uniref:aldo/keto reductase n=1 Tax=Streptomyces hydrogenans TaxID=1873719 RepID=UPI0036697E4B
MSATILPKSRFGRAGTAVSRIGLGTYHLTSDRSVPHEEAVTMVREAVRLGVTAIDTAPLYGLGEAEFIVGEALRPIEDEVFLINKVGRFEKSILARHGDACYRSKELIRAQFDHSMRLLGRDRLDMLLLHESDWAEWWDDLTAARGPVMELVDELKAEGRIGGVGLSARKPEETRRLCDTGRFDSILYVHYCNLVWQESVDEILPHAEAQDMGVAIGAPYRQGLLLGGGAEQAARLRAERRASVPPGIVRRIEEAERIAAEAGLSMPELGLRWLLSQSRVHTVMVGPRTVRELEQNVEWAAKPPLEESLLKEIAGLQAIEPGSWEV